MKNVTDLVPSKNMFQVLPRFCDIETIKSLLIAALKKARYISGKPINILHGLPVPEATNIMVVILLGAVNLIR